MFWVIFPKKKFILMVLIIITVLGLGFTANWALDYYSYQARFNRIYDELTERFFSLKTEDDIALRTEISFASRDEEGNITSQGNSLTEFLLDETYFQRFASFVNLNGDVAEIRQVLDLRNDPYVLERMDYTGERGAVNFSQSDFQLNNRFDSNDTLAPFESGTRMLHTLSVSESRTNRVWHYEDVYSFHSDPEYATYVYYPDYSYSFFLTDYFDDHSQYLYYHLSALTILSFDEMQWDFRFMEDGSMSVYYHFVNFNNQINEFEMEINFSFSSEPIDEIQISFANTNMYRGFPTREIAEKFVISNADDIAIDIGYGNDWMTVYFEDSQIIDFPIGYPWTIYLVDGNYNMVNEQIVVDAGSTLTFHVQMDELGDHFIIQSPFFLD